MSKPIVSVTATDLETGETGTRELEAGDYIVIPVEPLYVHGEQRHANGTITITLKRRDRDS